MVHTKKCAKLINEMQVICNMLSLILLFRQFQWNSSVFLLAFFSFITRKLFQQSE